MTRKFSFLLVVSAVAAFWIPASASAAPEITAGGASVPVNGFIKGTSVNTVIKTSIGNITCAVIRWNTQIVANNGARIEGNPAFLHTENCFLKGNIPITVDDETGPIGSASLLLSLNSEEVGKGSVGMTVTATLPNNFTCHYQGTAIPFTYTSGGAALNIKGGLTAKPAACGTASIEGTYALSSTEGAVVVH